MSLVYLHACTLVQLFMSRESAASNFAISNFHLVTLKIRYFEFHYVEFSRKTVNFSLWTLWKIFRKFHDFSWKIHENKGRLLTNFVCITFAQYGIMQTKQDLNGVFWFPDPTNMGCFFSLSLSLPPSVDPTYINIILTNGKQDVLKQPEANTDLLYFSALSYYKSSVETNFPIFAIAFLH